MPVIDPRDEQMFPKFGARDIGRLRRFGEKRQLAPANHTGPIAGLV
jgi:hypothetical protein